MNHAPKHSCPRPLPSIQEESQELDDETDLRSDCERDRCSGHPIGDPGRTDRCSRLSPEPARSYKTSSEWGLFAYLDYFLGRPQRFELLSGSSATKRSAPHTSSQAPPISADLLDGEERLAATAPVASRTQSTQSQPTLPTIATEPSSSFAISRKRWPCDTTARICTCVPSGYTIRHGAR
jgi:hypothetical protein